MAEDAGDLCLELGKASLIALERLRVTPQADAALVGYDYNGIPGSRRLISRRGRMQDFEAFCNGTYPSA